MKVWKKFSAVALALVMVMALCVPAFATLNPTAVNDGDMKGDATEDGILGEFGEVGKVKYTYTNKDVLLYKELTVYNYDETTINAPTITYNYTVTAGVASGEDAITDEFGTQQAVKAGILDGVTVAGAVSKTSDTWNFDTVGSPATTGHLTFTPTVQLKAASSGEKNVFPIKVAFNSVTFTAAGVYRYIITETVDKTSGTDDEAKNAAGIADGTISNVRYLDVYVKDGSTSGSYDIYGFVCFQNLQDPDKINGKTGDSNNVIAVAKTEGFVADAGATGNSQTADTYYTFNVIVSKTLVNDQAMNNNKFPFYVNMKNSSVTVPIILKTKTVEDGATATTPADEANTSNLSTETTGIARTPEIDHQSNIKYIGIPVGITEPTVVTVYETNNVTGTTYTSDYKIDTQAVDNSSKVISWIAANDANKSKTATLTVTMNAADTKAHEIAFTNTLMNISPTGVTLRYAPYLAMMGAGIVALPLSLRKKEELD